jgi:hypothetical protein
LFLQLLTVLAEKPPASAGYRGSDLVPWAQRRGPGGAGRLQELDEEPTYRWGDRLSSYAGFWVTDQLGGVL